MFSGDGNPQFWFRQWSRAAVVPRLNNSYTLAVSESGNGKLQHIGQQWHRDVCNCTNFSALRPLYFCTILLLRFGARCFVFWSAFYKSWFGNTARRFTCNATLHIPSAGRRHFRISCRCIDYNVACFGCPGVSRLV
jgi:hypothetical protein